MPRKKTRRGRWMATAQVQIPLGSSRDALAISRALVPEAKSRWNPRAKVAVSRRNRTLLLRVVARDTAALRALLNSYLRFVAAWKRVATAIHELESRTKSMKRS